MRKILQICKDVLKANALVFMYFIFAVVVELTAVFVVEGTPFISRPFLGLGLLFFVCGGISLIRNNRARATICAILLFAQVVFDLVFSVLYDMTDQYFDIGMLNLRNDAFAILENIPVDFIAFYSGLFCSIACLVLGLRHAYYHREVARTKRSVFFNIGLMAAGLATLGIAFFTYYPREAKDRYDEMIHGKETTAYSAYGMIGNLMGEVGKKAFQKITPLAEDDINSFVYAKESAPTEYFGVSKGKNVVVVLSESLEWYTFLRGNAGQNGLDGEYPNALDIPQETLEALYPNLTEYYEESLVATNFHGREKTDIAEVLSIVGSYPTDAYVNYEYAENTIPYTLPNILKQGTGNNVQLRSFHNGFKSFYNRGEAHKTLGFEGLTDMDDMVEISSAAEVSTFTNYMNDGERNLDSEMIETAKHLMFPTDGKQFFTYITTITMHGMYYDRDNLQPENNTKLAEKITLLQTFKPREEDGSLEEYERAEALYYYMATALEFDYMLGCMKADLQKKGLWEDTIVVLFGDHNAYYQELSNYVKDIHEYEDEAKYTDLYNVPLMIHDAALVKKLAENGESRIVTKFLSTADIVPTLLDLLGIKYFENLYYGKPIFSDETSVLYSRAYGVFVGDGILRRSVKGKLYQYDGLTESGVPVADTLSAFEKEGVELVERIKYCDYIFRQDHFGKEENYDKFLSEMRRINGWQ